MPLAHIGYCDDDADVLPREERVTIGDKSANVHSHRVVLEIE
jgi:hypothetical protein